ncbi:hypothetical protein DPV78_011678 [Talaromyces pinophilus]|nr:hypothetical protein DPV78_011678 [Talaromyces pinophilus]
MDLAVRKRVPWRNFFEITGEIPNDRNYGKQDSVKWSSSVIQTVSTLIHYGGDPNLKSATSRTHHCGPSCWKSVDCEHLGQRVLHFASASGEKDVVTLLLDHGADPNLYDDDGYLPLYWALAQGQPGIALKLLGTCLTLKSIIVSLSRQSTALHIGFRFACLEVILYLLKKGATMNTMDSTGCAAIEEALSQQNLMSERLLIHSFQHLGRNGD